MLGTLRKNRRALSLATCLLPPLLVGTYDRAKPGPWNVRSNRLSLYGYL